jgi:hypothetical protein
MRQQLETALRDFESDYTGLHWRPMGAWLERRFAKAAKGALTLHKE